MCTAGPALIHADMTRFVRAPLRQRRAFPSLAPASEGHPRDSAGSSLYFETFGLDVTSYAGWSRRSARYAACCAQPHCSSSAIVRSWCFPLRFRLSHAGFCPVRSPVARGCWLQQETPLRCGLVRYIRGRSTSVMFFVELEFVVAVYPRVGGRTMRNVHAEEGNDGLFQRAREHLPVSGASADKNGSSPRWREHLSQFARPVVAGSSPRLSETVRFLLASSANPARPCSCARVVPRVAGAGDGGSDAYPNGGLHAFSVGRSSLALGGWNRVCSRCLYDRDVRASR